MQVVFLRPLLMKALGIGCDFNPYVMYQFTDGVMTKITDMRYEINESEVETFIKDVLDLFEYSHCIPFLVSDCDSCDSMESAVRNAVSGIRPTDILWIEPEVRKDVNGNRSIATLFNYVSHIVYLRNGKRFLRTAKVKIDEGDSVRSLGGCYTDFRLLQALSDSLKYEELLTDIKVNNYASVINKIIRTMQTESLEWLLNIKAEKEGWFNNEYDSAVIKVGGIVHFCRTTTDLLSHILGILLDDVKLLDEVSVVARFKEPFQLGEWECSDGTSPVIGSNALLFKILNNIEDEQVLLFKKKK